MAILSLLFLFGFIASLLGGLVGLGGGFLIIPALIHILHIPIQNAIFLSLCSIVVLSFLKSVHHRSSLKLHQDLTKKLTLYAIGGALLSSYLSGISAPSLLKMIFSIVILTVGLTFIFPIRFVSNFLVRFPALLVGRLGVFLAAGLGGLLGIGGGIIYVPLFHRWMGLEMRAATQVSLYFIFFTSTISTATHYLHRRADIQEMPILYLVSLLAGTLVSHQLSRNWKVSDARLKKLFGILIILIALWNAVSS